MNKKVRIKRGDLEGLADSILEGVDYDLYKEDLEGRRIMTFIEEDVEALLTSYGILVEEFK